MKTFLVIHIVHITLKALNHLEAIIHSFGHLVKHW
nr:hypothetical protein [Mucilaginibacter sp. X4EP1]